MKRTPDKIKDFVEAKPYDPVENYSLDLPRSLAAYRFTEVTSDLLANWLDALANLPKNRGAARALAGLRGVGKSHTLACFAALSAIPDLRAKVSDPHVGTSARRLLSRRYTVVRVERGTRPTLLHELKAAFSEAIGGGESDWPDDPAAMLAVAASRMGDSPLVVIIDTAIGRESRVMRNDGPVLTALAHATQALSVYIGLALDDDIEGADGANVGLSGSYQIDYLELEHLYRIVDTHLFHKNARARVALREMYLTLRTAVPGFNWSEPRFSAVYPVHPLVGDVSAVVRLYAPTFAFLPFVAAAVARSTNRPAFSLITLDEIFDRCDYEFRKAEHLREAFSIYDSLAAEAINKFPIMQRLQAKLVLKALFILSLDGRGATARDIGAAMLMYDEQSPETAIKVIDEMLARFASEAPTGMLSRVETPEGDRFCLTISASAGFEAALNGRISESAQDDALLLQILKQTGRVRFEDWPFQDESLSADVAVDSGIIWRGTPRYGRLVLGKADTGPGTGSPVKCEWTVIMSDPSLTDSGGDLSTSPGESATDGPDVLWLPAGLRSDEVENLKRLAALRGDVDLFSRFGETARASERMYASLVERSFGRVFIDDGRVVIKGVPRPLSKDSQSAKTLSDLLAATLAPVLGARYAKHPIFAEVVTEKDVSDLVASFFGGAGSSEPHIQQLAERFAVPLGLAVFRADHYALEAGDGVLKQPWVRDVITLADSADGQPVPIEEVYSRLRAEPYGLLRESQHLVLAALVAQRRVNLVTANGDRITRRTLGQRLKWDDVYGVARAENILHTSEELTAWAKALTGDNSLAGIVEPPAREAVRKAMTGWLSAWRAGNPLHNFSNLPDEALTTRVWNLASVIRKSFGAAGEAIEDALSDEISLEEGLQRVVDAFNDSHEYFKACSENLSELSTYSLAIKNRESIRAYIASAEATDIDEIESIRRELIGLASNVHNLFDAESNKRFEMLWTEFHRRHIELVAGEHERTVGTNASRSPIDEVILSDDWRDFELLSRLTIVNSSYWAEALSLIENGKLMRCDLPVRRVLETRARCSCGFKLSAARNASESAQSLIDVVRRGLEAHFRTLMAWRAKLTEVLFSLAEAETDNRRKARKAKLAERLADGDCKLELTAAELDLLEEALQSGSLPPLRVEVPSDISGLLTREELRGRLRQWVDDLPDHPALVDVVSRS